METLREEPDPRKAAFVITEGDVEQFCEDNDYAPLSAGERDDLPVAFGDVRGRGTLVDELIDAAIFFLRESALPEQFTPAH